MGKFNYIIKLFFAVGAGIAAGYFLPTLAYKEASSVVASFAGIIVAALVPTMILAATILSPNVKGKKELKKIKDALSVLISFFSGLFLLTLILGALLILSSLLSWDEVVTVLPLSVGDRNLSITIHINKIIGGATVSLMILVIIQMTGFIHGVRSLFKFHADNIEKELDANLKEQARVISKANLPKDPRGKIGENIGTLE